MTNIQMFLCGLAAIVVFKFLGWIGAWGTGLGIGALLVVFFILQNLPDTQIRKITKLFFLVIGIWGLYNVFSSHTPLTGRALKMRERVTDLQLAQKVQPSGYYAMFGIAGAVDKRDSIESVDIAKRAIKLAQTSDDETFKKGIRNLVSELDELRDFKKEVQTKTSGEDSSFSGLIQDIQKTRGRTLLWALSIIGIMALVVSAVVNKDKTKITKTTFSVIGIILGVFVLDNIVYAQGTVGSPNMPSVPMPSFGNMPSGAVIMFGAIFFYLILLGIAFFSSNKKLWWGIFAFAVIAGLILWWASNFYTYYYHGGLKADLDAQNRMVSAYKGIQQKERAKIPQAKHYDKPTPIREGLEGEFPVTLDPVHWSKEIPFGEGYSLEFEMPGWYEVLASTGDRILTKNDGTTSAGVITYMKWDGVITYPNKMIFQRQGEIRWIRVRGEGEHGKVRVYR